MKKTLYAMMLVASLGISQAATLVTELSPTSTGISTTSATQNDGGISTSDVFDYTVNEWHFTYENSALSGQSAASGSAVQLQIGAAASNNAGGNYAAIKFDIDATNITSATLSFSHIVASSWGNSIANFDAIYTVTVYGFNATGEATELGVWSKDIDGSNLTVGEASSGTEDVDLALGESSAYDSYGIILHSKETSSMGSGAGVAMQFTDIKVTVNSVPEPATASLSLLGLAALMIRRRRA